MDSQCGSASSNSALKIFDGRVAIVKLFRLEDIKSTAGTSALQENNAYEMATVKQENVDSHEQTPDCNLWNVSGAGHQVTESSLPQIPIKEEFNECSHIAVGVSRDELTSVDSIEMSTFIIYKTEPDISDEPLQQINEGNENLYLSKKCSKAASGDEIPGHKNQQLFSCADCSYKSISLHYLKRHIRTHSGIKPFGCDSCGFRCTQKYHLIEHIRIHTGVRPFSCEFCDYKTSQKTHLNEHVRIHTGEKPFSCSFCEYVCSRKSHLKSHLKTHRRKSVHL